LRTELLAREITELEKAFALVQDLDATKFSFTSRSHSQTTRPTSSQYPNRFQGQTSTHKANTKDKCVENKDKGIDREFSKPLSQSNVTSVKDMDRWLPIAQA